MGRFRSGLQGGHLGGDVAGELHHFVEPPLGIEQRVVGRFEVNRLTLLVLALETVRVIFAAVERSPKRFVAGRFGLAAVTEQTVVLPEDFVERVLHGVQEVFIGRDHPPFGGEFDHRHGTANGRQHAFVFMFLVDPRGDISRDLDHAFDLPIGPKHRHVAGFKPDFLAALAQAQKGATDRLAAGQVTPQPGVLLAAIKHLLAEHPMVLAANFFSAITHDATEVFIGIEDDTLGGEFNHRHRTTDRRQLGIGLGQRATEAFDFQQVSLVM
ncbi:hypothetical protein D3C86_1352520 [compost metagenome]